jgi:uncharacterized protein DUF5985
MTFPGLVYILCFLTCTVCATLLVRGWLRTKTRLLLWTAVSFAFLALNNFFVIADLLIFPGADLVMFRYIAALVAGLVLISGLVWESE